MSITKEKRSELVKDFGKFETDTGSVEVQVAIFTTRITELTEHLKTHKKDFAGRRGLVMLVGKRRKLLRYISISDNARYKTLIEKLGIRK